MARLIILGGGISGHTAAQHARKLLGGKHHEVVVITPNSKWNWIPSNIWVGTGFMQPEQVTFDMATVYKKMGVTYLQAKATEIYPEGTMDSKNPFVAYEYTSKARAGEKETITYDFLINATGPKLKFEATDGLGPDKNTVSVCTYGHAAQAWEHLKESIERMKKGEKQEIVVGMGNGTCTCQGAAFEYLFNVEFELRRHKVRDKANITYISNEQELGDFGMGGMHIKKGGYVTHSRIFTESLFAEREMKWITRAGVSKIEKDVMAYETIEGEQKEKSFDFAMLLPPFSGVPMKAFDQHKKDITDVLFAKNGFMKVDADYSQKPFEEWSPEDWPSTYQNPIYRNIFAVGIAFAPPHAVSKPMMSPTGRIIAPAVPRTGMPSGVMARKVAYNIADMMKGNANAPTRKASMARMGAACIASAGANIFNGTAATMTMYPIVPDYEKYPHGGRDLNFTSGEIGLAGHWIKYLLHIGFMYKAKNRPFWQVIPE